MNDIQVHRSVIQMIYECYKSTYDWHTNNIQIAYKWFENDRQNIKLYEGFGAFRSNFQIFLWKNHCFRWLQMIFEYYVVPIPIAFIIIFLSSTTGSGNLNNLKVGPYYILQLGSMLFFLICSAVDQLFFILSPVKIYGVCICSFIQRDYA